MAARALTNGTTANPNLAALGQRYRSGQSVRLEEVFQAVRLSLQERHVVRERLTGRTYLEIVSDRAMAKAGGKGGRYTRQRMQQLEADARRKLGVGESLDAGVQGDERLGRALAMRERGRCVREIDLHHTDSTPPVRAALRKRPKWERAHEASVRAFLARHGE